MERSYNQEFDAKNTINAILTVFLFSKQGDYKNTEFIDFKVKEDSFIPNNFFTALLYEEIYYPEALTGATEYTFAAGKFVWKDDGLWFASVKG